MKILALDSSGLVAGVALTEDDILIAEYTTDYKKTHSQTLLPMLDELKKMVELDLHTVDVIGVAAGPGSFTGLRIGAATAKGLGLALGVKLAAVPTVDALAYNLYGCEKVICPMMDARRGQIYTGLYTFAARDDAAETEKEAAQAESGAAEAGTGEMRGGYLEMRVLMEQRAMSVRDLADAVNRLGRETVFLGDGVPVCLEALRPLLQVPFALAPSSCNRQRAAAVAVLAGRMAKQGRLVEADAFSPEYLRVSQAERERMEADEAQRERMKAGITPHART